MQLCALFERFNVKPLLAVIPQNEDPEFLKFPRVPVDFWQEIRDRRSRGWHIGLHGFRHRYDSPSSGVLGVSKRSEFAGHSYEEQLDRLTKAKAIFDAERIPVETFVAPSHSFDTTTLKALKLIGVRVVSDGFTLYPFVEEELLFVPQLVETPRWFPFGVHTFCLHPNTLTHRLLEDTERFLERYADRVISFDEAAASATESPWNRRLATLMRGALKCKRALA